MPRRKKEENMSYQERLDWIDQQIADHKEQISALRKQRKQLESSREQEIVQELLKYITESGSTPQEFLERLKEQKNQ